MHQYLQCTMIRRSFFIYVRLFPVFGMFTDSRRHVTAKQKAPWQVAVNRRVAHGSPPQEKSPTALGLRGAFLTSSYQYASSYANEVIYWHCFILASQSALVQSSSAHVGRRTAVEALPTPHPLRSKPRHCQTTLKTTLLHPLLKQTPTATPVSHISVTR